MAAGNYNFTIEQGSTFTRTLTWRDSSRAPRNLTSYSAKLTICNDSADILELNPGSGLTLGGAAGTIAITISAAQAAALNFVTAKYVLQLTSGSVETRLLRGSVSLKQGDA